MRATKRIVIGLVAGILAASNAFAQGHHGGPKRKSVQARVIEIAVTSEGFVPALAKIKVGQPVKLVVTRKIERTCATDIVIKDYAVNQPLPLKVPVEVTFTPTRPGKIRYSCAMDMIAGVLVAE